MGRPPSSPGVAVTVTDVAVLEANAIDGTDGKTAGMAYWAIRGISKPATGVVATDPLPSWPKVLVPQHVINFEVVNAHAVCPPVSSLATSANPVT
jgi:hypothetical protein